MGQVGAATQRVAAAVRWNLRLWFEPLLRFLFPELSGNARATGASRGTGFMVLSLVLTPIYVPVCVLYTLSVQLLRR